MKNKKKRVVKLLPLLLVGVLGVFLLLSPAVKISGNRFVLTKEETNLNQTTPLKDIVNTALEGATGTYGIVIQNLKTGETYYSNEQIVFDAGSLYKLWVMATAYQQIKNGQLQENQVLSQDATVLNQEFNIDANSAEQTEGEVTFTVADALTQMITVSDNYTALLLTEKVGLSAVATFLKENGLTKSNLGSYNTPPTTTPYDTALFFKKLYQSELANQQNTQEMLNLLANQQLNNGLPKY
ncbi:MAG: serine hydrolase, partial [Patescibacteria group bacterium]